MFEALLDSPLKPILRIAYGAALGVQSVVGAAWTNGNRPRVFYGGARAGDIGGPLVKVKRLAAHFPERRWDFNLVYLLSGAPYLSGAALGLLKRRNIPLVANQNGVFYPGWYGGDWRAMNRRMAAAYHLADHILWQSEFCRLAAERFLGPREGAGEVLYNAVDTDHYTPLETAREGQGFSFLVTGKIDSHLFYRLEASLRGLSAARGQGLDARLNVAGWLSPEAEARSRALAGELGLDGVVSFSGAYGQQEAPAIYRAADAYLMLKHNDPCPNTVLEALACGLPVLYSATGGVAELVGPEAGIGLPCEEDWEQPHWPDARAVADGMAAIAERRDAFGDAARRRAVANFDLAPWIARHGALFEAILETKS